MKAAVIVLALFLTGCGTVRTVRVDVPVAVPCRAPDVATPQWAIDLLPADADEFDIARAALVEIEQRRAYEAVLRAALLACA